MKNVAITTSLVLSLVVNGWQAYRSSQQDKAVLEARAAGRVEGLRQGEEAVRGMERILDLYRTRLEKLANNYSQVQQDRDNLDAAVLQSRTAGRREGRDEGDQLRGYLKHGLSDCLTALARTRAQRAGLP